MQDELFEEASRHFESSDYERGLSLINKCIQLHPTTSALYLNRALFHSQLANIHSAVQDLLIAIRYDHLNYAAYFNLFSLQFKNGQIQLAFDNLCCSLSCLYLLRAKKSRRELDVVRSIKYAQNNFEAHILKSLMHLQDGKYKLALNQIEWALGLHIHIPLCMAIKNTINRSINPDASIEVAETLNEADNFRLHTTYEPNEIYDEEIRQRVNEFNEIYDELSNFGTITQKIPKMKFDHDQDSSQSSSSDINGIFSIKKREIISPDNKEIKSELPTKQHLPNQQDKSQPEEDEHNQLHQETSITHTDSHSEQKSISKDQLHQHLQESGKSNIANIDPAKPTNDRATANRELNTPLPTNENNQIQPQNENKQVDSNFEEQSAQNSALSSKSQRVEIYPIKHKKKIQFTIISAHLNRSQNSKDVYLIGNYNSPNGQRLKTPNKRVIDSNANWYTCLPPTPISEKSASVTVKVFIKNYFSFEDELVGQGEMAIEYTGEISLNLKQDGHTTGSVLLRVDLV